MATLETGSQLRVFDLQGKGVGTFVVCSLRARGGQGYVYTLRGPDGKPAVLKVPSPKGLFGNEIEIRILKTLPPHKNIVRLLGTTRLQGVECAILGWGHPNPYQRLNAKHLDGATRRFRGGSPKTALPATTAVEMIQEVLAALEHMHRYSFVHGDIKPGNIMAEIATRETELTNAKYFGAIQNRAYRTILADFGSTRSVSFLKEREKEAKDKLIAPSEFTPIYAPPEVFDRKAAHPGPSVDVYQVGILFYQLLSGHLPYDHHGDGSVAKVGLTGELVQLKRAEYAGRLRCYEPAYLRDTFQDDVVFAEAFASQGLRDQFVTDALTFIDMATTPQPRDRPTITELRAELLTLFQLEPPRRSVPSRLRVSVWNPRWHLTRTNRLLAASRAADRGTDRFRDRGAAAAAATELLDTEGVTEDDVTGAVTVREEPGELAEVAAPVGSETVDIDRGPDLVERPAWEPRRRAKPRRPRRPPAQPAKPTPPRRPEPGEGRFRKTEVVLSPRERLSLRLSEGASEPSGSEGGSIEGLRIALVDDDRVALAVLGRSLRARGCQVRTFQDPEAGLESISRDQPDAAIIDMQMPVLSGLELIKRLRRRLNGLPFPVLVLSSVEEEEVLKESYRLGVRDYLVKPVTEAELAVKLEQAIQHSRESVPEVPRELGGFELLEEIRRGEAAIVYSGADLYERYPESPVKAIKVLRPELVGGAEPLLQMRREVDVLASCDHPGIVRLQESGLFGQLLFYVADEIPARSLGKEVRESGMLEVPGVLAMLREVGEAIAHLHEASILIGDLGPESIGRTESGRLMISELGNARWLGPTLRLDEPWPARTRYGAPELFEEPPLPDLRADLYSLGIVALELYSGSPAVRGRSSGRIDVGALTAGMPQPLVSLLANMVEPDPNDRVASTGQLLRELERIQL